MSRVERFNRASVAHRLSVGIVDKAPENVLGNCAYHASFPSGVLPGNARMSSPPWQSVTAPWRRGDAETEFPTRFVEFHSGTPWALRSAFVSGHTTQKNASDILFHSASFSRRIPIKNLTLRASAMDRCQRAGG